jgi:hypothetical protein
LGGNNFWQALRRWGVTTALAAHTPVYDGHAYAGQIAKLD